MPLTSVIEYLNVRLPALHPRAHLRQGARYRLHRGLLSARVAGLTLTPYLVPVHVPTGALFGQRAKLFARTDDGHPAHPDAVYVRAWDAEDMVFLDHFLHSFQALNYLHQGHDARAPLVLDVQLRHLAAVPEHQGLGCETLLNLLGLRPDQIVLRLDAQALHGDAHLQDAAKTFAGRGYRLLAAHPDLANTDWDLLGSAGVRWVAPRTRDLAALHRGGTPAPWQQRHRTGPIGLWLDGVDTPEALAYSRALGADLIEGGVADPDSAAKRRVFRSP